MYAAVLAFLLLATTSQGPPPTPSKAAEKHQNQGAPDVGKAESNQKARGPVSTTSPETFRESPLREQQDFSKKGEDEAPTNWWSVTATTLNLLFTGLLVLLMYRQWNVMTEQSESMKGQLAEMKDQRTLASGQFEESKKQIAASAADTEKMIETASRQADDIQTLASANKDTVAVMLRQLEAYERPWVTASLEARSGLYFDNAGLVVTFGVLLKNIGRSIATHITYDVEIVPVSAIGEDYARVIAKQDVITKRLEPQASGYVVFADDDIPTVAQRRLDSDSIKRNVGTVNGEQYLTLCLAVVITYRYPTSDRPHTTRLAFIFGNITEPIEDLLFVKFGQTLPRENITIFRLTSGNYAD